MKHFTLTELGADSESPMIGTISNVEYTDESIEDFSRRAVNAIEEHFDAEVTPVPAELITASNLIFDGSPYEDIEVQIIGIGGNYQVHTIRLLETWLY